MLCPESPLLTKNGSTHSSFWLKWRALFQVPLPMTTFFLNTVSLSKCGYTKYIYMHIFFFISGSSPIFPFLLLVQVFSNQGTTSSHFSIAGKSSMDEKIILWCYSTKEKICSWIELPAIMKLLLQTKGLSGTELCKVSEFTAYWNWVSSYFLKPYSICNASIP